MVRPDGNPGTYSTVRIKPGVCVIAIDNDDILYLTKEFHYAVGRDTIEGVSGGIEDTETAQLAAKRELAEEIGAPRAARAVGNALRSNPITIVIPCHRVVRSDGSLGGYGGEDREQRKATLLELELSSAAAAV